MMRPWCLCVDGRRDNPPQIEKEAARDGEALKREAEKKASKVGMCRCIIYKGEDLYFISWDAQRLPGALTTLALSWTDIRDLHLKAYFCVSIEIKEHCQSCLLCLHNKDEKIGFNLEMFG